jgi:hypothetical protein
LSIVNRLFKFDAAILVAGNLNCRGAGRPVERPGKENAPMKRRLIIIVALGPLGSAPAVAGEECNIADSIPNNLQPKLASEVNLPDAKIIQFTARTASDEAMLKSVD